ncbi:hypothetical protein FACS1894137_15380 [Spirochaetia bacterium]|nr:hypothetical protein FACS1894137_14210 [Spirochaetia bacterium]GHT87741.1 hypothetical protein FACS1894137_15380 [Spirochaetia bacterium]
MPGVIDVAAPSYAGRGGAATAAGIWTSLLEETRRPLGRAP